MRFLLALTFALSVGVFGVAVPASAQVACDGGPKAVVSGPQGLTLCKQTVKVPVVTHDEPQAGIRVAALSANSPLADAGLVAGDVIYRARFTRVSTADELLTTLGDVSSESGLTINFWRGEKPYLIRVWIGSQNR